ncbi:MAG: DUF4177 domain-containing protein [Bacteroidales bacterium]|nr:DUF4177 domain-containing protein [Bacteroidales bacterium]
MKKFFIAISCAFLLTACGGNKNWEYKIVKITGESGTDFSRCSYDDPSRQLNRLGEKGWELVDVYTEIETVHPNFGNSEYVTGLRPNSRTAVVNFVFKRPKTDE